MCPSLVIWTTTVLLLQMPPSPMPTDMQPSAEALPMPMPPSHPPVGEGPPPAQGRRFADLPDVISRLDGTEGLREAPKTFEIASSIAAEYAQADRVEEAAFYLGQAWEKTAEVRALFVQLAGAAAEASCQEVEEGKELAHEFAKAKAQKPQAKQAACIRRLMPRVLETGRQLAIFQVLSKDMAGAKKTWESLLALDNASLEAAYALGVLLLETEGDKPASLERARQLLQKVVDSKHPHAGPAKAVLKRVEAALEAGGNANVRRARSEAFKPAGLNAMPAPSQAQVLEEAERLLAQKQYQQAMGLYLKLVDSQQRSARVEAGLAFALGQQGTPGEMAQRMWKAAQESPEALEALAQALKAHGNEEGAKWIWQKLGVAGERP